MPALKFVLRPESFCISRLPREASFDLARLRGASWYSVTRTDDELSVVAPADIDLGATDRQAGWSCLEIAGPLEFGLVGIIAEISTLLARAGVSLFAISTYGTDHILVRTADIGQAVRALTAGGHIVSP